MLRIILKDINKPISFHDQITNYHIYFPTSVGHHCIYKNPKTMGLLNDLKFEVGPQITLSDLKNKVINK